MQIGCFRIENKCTHTRARRSAYKLCHTDLGLPVFMPVATKAAMKGLSPEQVEKTGCRMILANTYHMHLSPGQEILDKAGGVHKFMRWRHGLLTDSGGFQMVSLAKSTDLTEEGVRFVCHEKEVLLTPEQSISMQNTIGADICMQLDSVVPVLTEGAAVETEMLRSIRWLDRCIKAHKNPETQILFPIIQGGLDLDLRKTSIDEIMKRNPLGIAIGGLSGGERKKDFAKVVDFCVRNLPENLPKYCMGVGYLDDLLVCVALGVDMFDCVYPTRTARFGVALSGTSTLNLRNSACASDRAKIDDDCRCDTCREFSRAYLHLHAGKTSTGATLISNHNIYFMTAFMRTAREAVRDGTFLAHCSRFFRNKYGTDIPDWILYAFNDLLGVQI